MWTPAGVRLVALSGGPSPRGGIYRSFDQLTLNARAYDTGPFFVLAFRATMRDGTRSVVVEPCYAGAAREPLATGDRLGKDVVDDIAITQLGFALCCVIDVRRSKQRFKKAVMVHEATVVHADALREGRQVPGLGQITCLLTPPAANMQAGVVALEFKGGRSGLAFGPILSDPEVFAKTGDPAPGLPNQYIQSFGPPVSNNGVLPTSLFGVVSRVGLSDGPEALWAGVFTQQIPLGGEAIVPLIEGDSIDDRPDLIVRDFTPLKLTNSGTLLLRATLEQDGASHQGLLLLDRLFDWLA